MTTHIEKQLHFIVQTENGLKILMVRLNGGPYWINQHEMDELTLTSKWLNDSISWNGTDMNMTKFSGKIVAKRINDWNYSKPIGKRCENIRETLKFVQFHKQIK